MLTTYTVDSVGDGGDSNTADGICDDGLGACTLRASIEQSNANAGADTIDFNIGGGGAQTILLSSVLPTIADAVTIDGSSQLLKKIDDINDVITETLSGSA